MKSEVVSSKNKLDPVGTLDDVRRRVEEYETRVISGDVEHNSLSRDRAFLLSLVCSRDKTSQPLVDELRRVYALVTYWYDQAVHWEGEEKKRQAELAKWQANFTGRHGSQMPCLSVEPSPRQLTESERASFERALRNSTRVVHEGELVPEKATQKPWTKGGNPVGTSLKGYAHVPYSRVVEVFGEPVYRGDEGDARIIFDWTITFSDGTVATVYDYKQSKLYGDDPDAPTPEEMKALQSFEWHIGGKSQRAVELVLNALNGT